MKNKKMLLITAAALVLLLTASTYIYSGLKEKTHMPEQAISTPAHETGKEEKNPAPFFTVYDRSGKRVHFADFAGKPTVLNFWASWCGPCRMEMPDFDAVYRELGKDVNFMMVNMTDGTRETVEKAYRLVSEQGFSFPVFYDKDMDAARSYGVSSLPATYFIDKDGNVIARAIGAIDSNILRQGIGMICPDK